MFGFIKNVFVAAMSFFSCKALKCASMINQKCKIWLEIININSNQPLFYPCNVNINERAGSCNIINDPCEKLCVSDVVKNINVEVCNLMSRTN